MPASGTNAVSHLQNHAKSIATWWSLEIMESKQRMISKLNANERSASCRAKALTVYHTKSVASVCVTCTNLSKQNGLVSDVSDIRYAHILSTLVLDISRVLSCHITCHTCHMLLCHVVSIGPLSCGSCGSMHWVTNNKQCFAARQTRHLASHTVLACSDNFKELSENLKWSEIITTQPSSMCTMWSLVGVRWLCHLTEGILKIH